MNCGVCGQPDPEIKLEKSFETHSGPRVSTIFQCRSCRLAWWEPPEGFRPEDTYDASYFADSGVASGYDDYRGLEQSLGRTFAARLSRIVGAAGDSGRRLRLLDIGAAYGFAVAEALRVGLAAYGIEISLAAAREANRRCDQRIAVADGARTPFADATFDVVTLWDVIEHLPDPVALTREIRRVLRPGGRLILTTGDVESPLARISGARWHLYNLPEHLYFFSRPSLTRLLCDAGFEIDDVSYESAHHTLGYLMERLRKTVLGRSGSGKSFPGAGISIPINLFDIVRVTARRA